MDPSRSAISPLSPLGTLGIGAPGGLIPQFQAVTDPSDDDVFGKTGVLAKVFGTQIRPDLSTSHVHYPPEA